MAQFVFVQITFASSSGSFPGIDSMAETAAQAVRDAFYVNFPGNWEILYSGVNLATGKAFDPNQPQHWYVERKPALPEIDYYRSPKETSYLSSAKTTWPMIVLERSDYPDNKLLVYFNKKNGAQIWIKPEQVQTCFPPDPDPASLTT